MRARRYRFRLLNDSVSRYFNIALVDGAGNSVSFYMVATDGNIMEHSVYFANGELPTQGIAERYDIGVDFFTFTSKKVLSLRRNDYSPLRRVNIDGTDVIDNAFFIQWGDAEWGHLRIDHTCTSFPDDPDNDTPTVLKHYRKRFKARWTFLTGNKADIVLLHKKLGLYIDEIQDGSNNHNVNMIIGNQSTGRWMKRSPFENPYVLADQLGYWLNGWK